MKNQAAVLALITLFGCGGDDDGTVDRDAGFADAGPRDAGPTAPLVPVPPMTDALEWPDTEPNDTPEQAVPVGNFAGALWMGFSMPFNAIDDDDDVDYYVFRAPDAETLPLLLQGGFAVCWRNGMDLLDLRLYAVTEGRQGPLVGESATNDIFCEDLLAQTTPTELLMPDGIYLLEVRAAPGLMLGGSPGLYEA